jgi:hypothetical protein
MRYPVIFTIARNIYSTHEEGRSLDDYFVKKLSIHTRRDVLCLPDLLRLGRAVLRHHADQERAQRDEGLHAAAQQTPEVLQEAVTSETREFKRDVN